MQNQDKKDTHKKLITDLNSKDNELILNSIKALREEGISSDIPILINLLNENSDPEIQKYIRNLLIDIKDSAANELIIEAIKDQRYSDLRKDLVSICWESRLDFSNYLEVFINILIDDNFLTSFEAFTVIENMTGNISDEEKKKHIQKLKDSIPDADSERKEFLHEAIHLIENISEDDKY